MGFFDFLKKKDVNNGYEIEDDSFIAELHHISKGPWHQYDVTIGARGYGWEGMLGWANYMASADLEHISKVSYAMLAGAAEEDITEEYLKYNDFTKVPSLQEERGVLSVGGMSKTVRGPMQIVWINQTNFLRFFTIVDDENLMRRYAETVIRRTFNTKDAMKLARPIQPKPVEEKQESGANSNQEESIEALKAQLNEAKKNQGDWQTPYTKLLKAVYNRPVLFFALSKGQYDAEKANSEPLISTKDFGGVPALYVFTDVEIASGWMQHYGFITEDMKYGLIGAIEKQPCNFQSTFTLARHLGVQMIMLDEGGSYVAIRLDQFMEVNGIDPKQIEIAMSKEESANMLDNNVAPEAKFARIAAIPLTKK